MEQPLDKVGLLNNNLLRFGVFTTAAAGAFWIFKPRGLYVNGKPVPSVLTEKEPDGFHLDWMMASLCVGAASVLFI